MNTKASNVPTGTSGADMAKYALAVLIAAAGVAAYYLFPSWPMPVRGLVAALGFAGAIALVAMTTALGARGREFASESMFELRKVVWPTPEEARKITVVVLIVVLVISLILFLMDLVIQFGIEKLLST
jgi:preprotein translocase subunit SecE